MHTLFEFTATNLYDEKNSPNNIFLSLFAIILHSTDSYSIIYWFQVYTDWANHYLDKAKSKKNIKDLQLDLADGVLLSDLVETICESLKY